MCLVSRTASSLSCGSRSQWASCHHKRLYEDCENVLAAAPQVGAPTLHLSTSRMVRLWAAWSPSRACPRQAAGPGSIAASAATEPRKRASPRLRRNDPSRKHLDSLATAHSIRRSGPSCRMAQEAGGAGRGSLDSHASPAYLLQLSLMQARAARTDDRQHMAGRIRLGRAARRGRLRAKTRPTIGHNRRNAPGSRC